MAEVIDYLSEKALQNAGDDRFALVVAAARRARDLNAGAPPCLEIETQKMVVLSLEEIVRGKVVVTFTDDKLPDKKLFT